jgi:hypothetical protein
MSNKLEGMWYWCNLRLYPGILFKELMKTTKNVSIAGLCRYLGLTQVV